MAEEVVEDVGLDDVVELLGLADPVGDRKLARRQQREEGLLGNQPRHADDLPAGGAEQPLGDVVEARDALGRAQLLHGGDELVAGQARQLLQLARVQAPVGVVVGCGVLAGVLDAGVVGAGARVVAARRAVAGAVGDGRDALVHALGRTVVHAVLRGRAGRSSRWRGSGFAGPLPEPPRGLSAAAPAWWRPEGAWGLTERRGASGRARCSRTAP